MNRTPGSTHNLTSATLETSGENCPAGPPPTPARRDNHSKRLVFYGAKFGVACRSARDHLNREKRKAKTCGCKSPAGHLSDPTSGTGAGSPRVAGEVHGDLLTEHASLKGLVGVVKQAL